MDRRKGTNRFGFRRIAFGDLGWKINAGDRAEHSLRGGSILHKHSKKCWVVD